MQNNISDQTFLKQFHDCSLDLKYFNHIGHIRMAWLMLEQYGLDVACDKGCEAILAYATSLGATEKFHKTITVALFHEIFLRGLGESWQSFVDSEVDLVHNSLSVLQQYYTETLLFSDAARKAFLQPDLKAFNE